MTTRSIVACGPAALVAAHVPPARGGDDPFADVIIDYDPGINPAPGYKSPEWVLGPPERFTGEGIFPGVVSAFNPPFGPDEIVSIGVDGLLVVEFATPVTDDPGNPFGIDLLIFGNAFFIDAAFPGGIVDSLFLDNGGVVEVSPDGVGWFVIEGIRADGLYPTIGYLDAGPYDTEPGTMPSDFTRPVDPSLELGDFQGLTNEEVIDLYAGSGGGAGIDIGAVGLASVCCVRITNPGDPAVAPNIEIDALADVAPEAIPGDINGDGVVNVSDLLLLLAALGPCPGPPDPCPADINGDGSVDVTDLLILLGAWTI